MSPLLLLAAGCASSIPRIDAPDLARALEENPEHYVVVDVRSQREWRGKRGHIAGALHLPYPGVKDRIDEIDVMPGQQIVLVCFTGHRSRWSYEAVQQAVDVPVKDLRGGMMSWWRHDLPTEVERTP
ncbi:MAG: rhodanese-like domain-containing protein [Myxococcales bacterium]|nr:rhodanese-like domain-containing protein [Myxococcales bacterium]